MQLNEKQIETIKHLQYSSKKTPQQIINFCYIKLTQHRFHNANGPKRRRHSIKHYQGIIDYLELGGNIPT